MTKSEKFGASGWLATLSLIKQTFVFISRCILMAWEERLRNVISQLSLLYKTDVYKNIPRVLQFDMLSKYSEEN